jgi:hypothetical protein
MRDNKIHALIEELKALKLREAAILDQLEVENKRRNREEREREEREIHHHGTTNHGFEQGDRIRITNQVKKPYNWGDDRWNYQEAKRATVTFATEDRIHFVTDNGVTTWRAPKNIQRL